MFRKMFNRLHPFMDADDGTEINEVEESEEMQEVAAPADDEEGEEEQEAADPAEDEQDKSDSAFADMRRRLKEAEEKAAKLEAEREEYDQTLGLFFEGDNKIAQAKAHYEGISLEEAQSLIAKEREDRNLKAENKQLEDELNQLRYERRKADDLAAIKEAYPDADLKDVEELGEEFFAYRTMGISAVDAFNGIQMKKSKPPKSMGKAKTAPPEKDFFTKEEVEAMSQSEVSKNYDKIRKSMGRWK